MPHLGLRLYLIGLHHFTTDTQNHSIFHISFTDHILRGWHWSARLGFENSGHTNLLTLFSYIMTPISPFHTTRKLPRNSRQNYRQIVCERVLEKAFWEFGYFHRFFNQENEPHSQKANNITSLVTKQSLFFITTKVVININWGIG